MTLNCSICFCDIESNDIKSLPCRGNHTFHRFCIDRWLRCHLRCPLCRDFVISALPESRTLHIPRHLDSDLVINEVSQMESRPGRNLSLVATRLGLAPIHRVPPAAIFIEGYRIIRHRYTWRITESIFGISSQFNSGWVPARWMNYSSLRFAANHPERRAFRALNCGFPCFVVTERFQPPNALRICTICDFFVTNSEAALHVHRQNIHRERLRIEVERRNNTL